MSDKDWTQTYTGKKFCFRNPTLQDISIIDISHSLSNICRFNGHCKQFYSVAEHSVYLSRQFDNSQLAMEALLDDAAEAYIGDMPRPIKNTEEMLPYREIEKKIDDKIRIKFDLSSERNQQIIDMDTRLLITERNQIMSRPPDDWGIKAEPLKIKIQCLSPSEAKEFFEQRYFQCIRMING
jgi:hypothetical protein